VVKMSEEWKLLLSPFADHLSFAQLALLQVASKRADR
jgi:hypothetical protein